MSLLIPGGMAGSESFDQAFFQREFKDGQVPRCDLIDAGDVEVVELVLVNGQVLDINCFEEFRRHHVVATVFVDPPECDHLYRSYIRYDAIFQVNVRHFEPTGRKLGFDKSKATPTVESAQLGFDKGS